MIARQIVLSPRCARTTDLFRLHTRRFIYRPGARQVANLRSRNSLQDLPPVRKGNGRHSYGDEVMVADDGLRFSL